MIAPAMTDLALLDWDRAEILLLDMDGTVLDLQFDNHFWAETLPAHYAERQGMSVDEAKAELQPRFRAAEGRLDWYCIEYWSRELGLDVLALKQAHAHGIRVLDGAEPFLTAQLAAGRRLWLVTNAHPQTLALKLAQTHIGRYFERCLSSHALGHAKEETGFWPRFADQCPVAAEACMMIDDNQSVLEAARTFGIGQQLRITCPDSRRPAHEAPHHMPAVTGLGALLDCE